MNLLDRVMVDLVPVGLWGDGPAERLAEAVRLEEADTMLSDDVEDWLRGHTQLRDTYSHGGTTEADFVADWSQKLLDAGEPVGPIE